MSNDYELDLDQDPLETEDKKVGVLATLLGLYLRIPRKLRIVLTIIFVALFIIFLLIALKPQAEKRPIPETVVSVDTVSVSPSSYPIVVNANGTVEAETRGDLVAQIRGEIVSVSENFKTGGTFKKGDVLIQIDQRDYQADLSSAIANMSQADAAYRQEKANAKQARLDWERLGNTSPAPDLVLRKPQLTAAKAQHDSAKAAAETARLNLSRTTLTAPYDGRIIQRRAVLGQYVGVGTPIAEVFATDGVEVRLPVSQEEFNQLGLNSFSTDDPASNNFSVVISSSLGGKNFHWNAEITRTDSTFDINTRQINVIAEVKDPFGKEAQQPALKIGQFVTARIQGRTVDDIVVVPNKSIREGRYVYVVRDGKLAKQTIKIVWQDDENALVGNDSGLADGELVVTTSLNSTLAGASAKLTTPEQGEPSSDPLAPNQDEESEDTLVEGDESLKDGAAELTEPTAEAINPETSEPNIEVDDNLAPNSEPVVEERELNVDELAAPASDASKVEDTDSAANEEITPSVSTAAATE